MMSQIEIKRASTQWVVSEYVDKITEKHRKSIEKETRQRVKWGWRPQIVFDTESEARAFVIDRARLMLKARVKEMKVAERRLRKCEERFGGSEWPTTTRIQEDRPW